MQRVQRVQRVQQVRFDAWLEALAARHLADLEFAEVTRALRALSSIYVERRERLATRGALDSAGKRAAYALYYSPLHFLTVQRVVDGLGLGHVPLTRLIDLGCGAGAAGAAWAASLDAPPAVLGLDAHPWAVAEAAFTYRAFGLAADVRRGQAGRGVLPRSADALVAGWLLNELDDETRDALRGHLWSAAGRHRHVLIVEPIATRVSPWWGGWADEVTRAGGRADEWRLPVSLPDPIARLDRAAGLRHDVLTARSLYRPAAPRA